MPLSNCVNLLGRGTKVVGGTTPGVGNVNGPASSTLSAVARYADTTGKVIKDSNVTLADSGTALVFSGAAGLTASGSNNNITLTPSGTGLVQVSGTIPFNINGAVSSLPTGGNVGIGSATSSFTGNNGDLVLWSRANSAAQIAFFTGTSLVQRVTIAPSGNLLLGGLTTDVGGVNVLQIPGVNTALWGATALATIGVSADTTAGVFTFTAPSAGSFNFTKKISSYNGITTAGWGASIPQAQAEVTAQAAANASIATYTVGAADGSFRVSGTVNVTAATVLSTTLNCSYTDKSNTARTMILPVQQLAGSFIAGGLITATGAWETASMEIRCKASTAITIFTAAGTFNTVTYSATGSVTQIG